jgi:hypothetical protein
MNRAVLVALALVATGCAAAVPRPSTPAPPQLAPCPGLVVTVEHGAPIGCDVTPPQRIDETGTTRAQCADAGGRYVEPSTCRGLDY